METRYLLVLLFVNLLCAAVSRPIDSSNENEIGDVEYESSDDPGDDDTVNEHEYSNNRHDEPDSEAQALNYEQHEDERDENTEDADNLNEDYKENVQQFKKFNGGAETPKTELVLNRESKCNDRVDTGKKTVQYEPQINVGNSVVTNHDKIDVGIESPNSKKLSGYLHKFYKTMHAVNKGYTNNKKYCNNKQFQTDRDRREVQETAEINLSNTHSQNLDMKDSANENEESAIKRHVKKLSSAELEELLKSLSEDKRALLKKIMDSDVESPMEKREITKKEGPSNVVSNLLESAQADSDNSLGLGSSASTDAQVPVSRLIACSESSDKNKEEQTTNSNEDTSGSDGTDNKQELTIEPKVEKAPVKDNLLGKETIVKIENKREISSLVADSNKDELSNAENSPSDPGDNGYNTDDDLSNLMEDEAQLHYDNLNDRNICKRDSDDLLSSDSMKALSESFPNSKLYDKSNPYSNSDMVPLIRVKRTNPELQVRAAVLKQSDEKVAFVPCRSENDDEDMNEGNEFEGNGFYERSNLELDSAKIADSDSDVSNQNQAINIKSDSSNLGTDTDSVLSGVEDVDENLMFSSGKRNKRTDSTDEDDIKIISDKSDNKKKSVHSMSTLVDESNGVSGSRNIISNIPHFQEDDAFGQLPHNYDRDLGRYKRVRRVKQKPTSDIDSSRS